VSNATEQRTDKPRLLCRKVHYRIEQYCPYQERWEPLSQWLCPHGNGRYRWRTKRESVAYLRKLRRDRRTRGFRLVRVMEEISDA